MPFFSQKKLPSNPPPANGLGLASQSTQQSRPVCTWSTHAPQCGPSPLPFPRSSHTLTATATAAGELFLFGGLIGHARLCASSDLYVFSTQDFSTTLLQTSGEVPTPRFAHGAALISTATLLICGGRLNFDDQNGLNHDTLYLLNLVSREWTRVVVNGPGPGRRYHPTTIVVGSKLFLFGGQTGGQNFNDTPVLDFLIGPRLDGKNFSDIWSLDLNCLNSQPLWETYEPIPWNEKPLSRYGHVSVTTEDCIIIFGGKGDYRYYNDTWSFDTSTRKWTELQCTGSIPSPRASHAAVLVDHVLYVFGGFTGKAYLDDLNALQLSTQRWFKFHNVGPSPHGRSTHAMASDGTRVFVLGGYSKGARADEISLIHAFDTKDIKYPEPRRNAVDPNEKTAQLARKSPTGPPTLEQPQHPKSSSLEAHGTSRLQNATPVESGRPASLEITHERNPGPSGRSLELTGVNSKPRLVPEDNVSEGSTEYHGKFAAPHSSSEGEVTRSELERQLSVLLAAQTERDQRNARLADELALKSDLLEQAEQCEKELTNVRAKLEAKESELEAVRLRLTDAERGWTESKAESDTLRAQTATGSVNRDEDQVTRRLMERVRVIEAEMASKRWNEKSIEEMECRNEE